VSGDPIHPQNHVDAIGGQHYQIPQELVVLNDHIYTSTQKGAFDIFER
jgi:hypothetical protein